MTDNPSEQLVEHAIAAAQHAYCPYSHFSVGAALLDCDGQLFVGVNVENASYGLTLCAERNAFVSAITEGSRQFAAIAIVAETLPSPCGACRQVMTEFCDPDFKIILATFNEPTTLHIYTLEELLPHAFSLKQNP